MGETLAAERHYSPREVAELWGLSSRTVQRIFEDLPGVLKIQAPCLQKKHNRRRRPRTTLRIPASLLARAHQDRSGGFGREIQAGGR